MNKILVIGPNWLGDSIFALPVFENLKANYPHSLIGVVAPGYLKEIYLNSPYLERFYDFSDRVFYRNVFRKISLVRVLKKEGFDRVFILRGSFTKTLICKAAGIPERIGYTCGKKSDRLLTTKVKPLDYGLVHHVDFYLGILKGAGLRIVQEHCRICLPENFLEKVHCLLEKIGTAGQEHVCMHTGANWGPKMWERKKFAALADLLIAQKDCSVLFTGSLGERESIEEIRRMMRYRDRAFNLAGRTSLLESATLFKTSRTVISADSGPLHLASAAGANTIALFGPTSETVTGPRGTGKSVVLRKHWDCPLPCYRQDCRNCICMQSIGVEDVFHEIEKIY